MTISGRYFLVGCPRSGTTLLQSLLAAHPQIHSFPESHFFPNLLQRRRKWQRAFKIGSSQTNNRIKEFLREVEREDLIAKIPSNILLEQQHIKVFISILDSLTQEEKKSIWLEKTPRHLHYIEYIQKYISDAKFMHIIREGRDVVASTYDVTHKHPGIWGGPRDIDTCIDRWISDFRLSCRYASADNHTIVTYKNLVDDPHKELVRLCKFVNVQYDDTMISNYNDSAKSVRLASEPWKQSVSQSIQSTGARKFREIFDRQQQHHILKRLAATPMSQLEQYTR